MYLLSIMSPTSSLGQVLAQCTSNAKAISDLRIELSWPLSKDNIQIEISGLSSLAEVDQILDGLSDMGLNILLRKYQRSG